MAANYDEFRLPSPFLSDTHEQWRATLRRFVDEHIAPFVNDWEELVVFARAFARAKYGHDRSGSWRTRAPSSSG